MNRHAHRRVTGDTTLQSASKRSKSQFPTVYGHSGLITAAEEIGKNIRGVGVDADDSWILEKAVVCGKEDMHLSDNA